jgi:excisionase family DNA binding protein
MKPRNSKPSAEGGCPKKKADDLDTCAEGKTQQTGSPSAFVFGVRPDRDKDCLKPRGGQGERIKFFTIADVAEIVEVATRTVRRWIRSGDLVAHRFRGVLRISERDLRSFLAVHRDG